MCVANICVPAAWPTYPCCTDLFVTMQARVLVPAGCVVMGVPDETGTLPEDCVFLQVM